MGLRRGRGNDVQQEYIVGRGMMFSSVALGKGNVVQWDPMRKGVMMFSSIS